MGQANDAIAYAQAQIGKPYVFATAGPDTFDCSGLIKAAYAHASPPVDLVHSTYTMIAQGVEVSQADLQPGDLVFPDAGHVQLYVGNNTVIEAANKDTPVRQGAMWGFWRGRRVTTDGKKASPLSPVATGVSVALDTLGIPNPLSAAATMVDVLRPFGKGFATITNKNFWPRVGMFVIGTGLLLIGVMYWMRRPIINTVAGTMNAVGSVASTAVQGAAFGFGAAKTGGGSSVGGVGVGSPTQQATSAMQRSVAPRTPQPPPASTPTPIAPRRTMPLPELERRTRVPPPTQAQASSVPRTTRKSSRGGRFVDYGPIGKHRMYEG